MDTHLDAITTPSHQMQAQARAEPNEGLPNARQGSVDFVSSLNILAHACSMKPAVESAVTRLLVSIKALLESLTQWSRQQVNETYVSDVYVRFGNDFNAAVAAFAAFNIDMA
mgnify:FL=1